LPTGANVPAAGPQPHRCTASFYLVAPAVLAPHLQMQIRSCKRVPVVSPAYSFGPHWSRLLIMST
jgi:hypothetical protein